MESLGLLVGHLLGDFIFQSDWMAANKSVRGPSVADVPQEPGPARREWGKLHTAGQIGFVACTIHCLIYTLSVWACSFWWMPWWGLLVCFLVHWPIDRYRLASWTMRNVSGQSYFASKEHPLFPWSIVVVDNTWHLITLYIIGLATAWEIGP